MPFGPTNNLAAESQPRQAGRVVGSKQVRHADVAPDHVCPLDPTTQRLGPNPKLACDSSNRAHTLSDRRTTVDTASEQRVRRRDDCSVAFRFDWAAAPPSGESSVDCVPLPAVVMPTNQERDHRCSGVLGGELDSSHPEKHLSH
jgi:hypothetical protein